MRQRLLVCAVVVHHPDFFVSGALANKVDFSFSDALYASAQAEDDFIGEPVRNLPRADDAPTDRALCVHLSRSLLDSE